MEEERFFELVQFYLAKQITIEQQQELNSLLKENDHLTFLFYQLTQPQQKRVDSGVLNEKLNQIIACKPTPQKRLFPFLRVAAAIFIGMITISLLWFTLRNSNSQLEFANKIETKNGERHKFTLPDGTTIWLNNTSSIAYNDDFGKSNREIALVGEAYFDVASNKSLPMNIHTKDITIKVVGTSFNVRSYPDENTAETSLVEGKIELYINQDQANPKLIHVEPGEKIKINYNQDLAMYNNAKYSSADDLEISKTSFVKKQDKIVLTEIAWKDNTLAFDAEPLKNAISKLEKWYDVKIEVKNDSLYEMRISGNYQEENIEDVLEILKLTGLKFNFKQDNRTIIIF